MCFRTFAPLTAMRVPVVVSPILITEVSMAAMVVSWWIGFSVFGGSLNLMVCGLISMLVAC